MVGARYAPPERLDALLCKHISERAQCCRVEPVAGHASVHTRRRDHMFCREHDGTALTSLRPGAATWRARSMSGIAATRITGGTAYAPDFDDVERRDNTTRDACATVGGRHARQVNPTKAGDRRTAGEGAGERSCPPRRAAACRSHGALQSRFSVLGTVNMNCGNMMHTIMPTATSTFSQMSDSSMSTAPAAPPLRGLQLTVIGTKIDLSFERTLP